jgi:hypothetical protein
MPHHVPLSSQAPYLIASSYHPPQMDYLHAMSPSHINVTINHLSLYAPIHHFTHTH